MTSRTGIEFIDTASKHWDINHWVRGGCLYGVMPSHGLTYAPPHNCACYPEAKLFGLNALAAESVTRKLPEPVPFDQRFEFGLASGKNGLFDDRVSVRVNADWPTFRGSNSRAGSTLLSNVPDDLKERFQVDLDGARLSTMTVAAGLLFFADVDSHTVHAVDADTGDRKWHYQTGGRIDSPPTFWNDNVIFGSADGWVYLLRASDGQLVWRFRAAPIDRRLMAFEQLESVWPVHGSVLVEKGIAWFVAGRSNFLDGGLRLFRLDLAAAKVVGETVINQVDPETRTNLQARLQTLQMPVGLSDILSTKDGSVYMRSQQFDQDGQRLGLGPHSGDAAKQGSVQRGDQAHLFAPMGFLDDTYFHRAYWVYGRSFAGGHNGYYQAGKYAPSGRLLVFDDENVYGFGRKPEYLRWTTTIEHQLFSASKTAPEAPAPSASRKGGGAMVAFEKSASLNPKGKAVTVEAWVKADKPVGVVIARGGPADGYAISLHGGKPRFSIRAANELTAVDGPKKILKVWTHLVGVLTADAQLMLFVDGKQVATKKGTGLLATDPLQSLEVGADDASAVGDYRSPLALTGLVDEVRIYHGALNADQIAKRFAEPSKPVETDAELVLSCSFENGKALDVSGNKNHGRPIAVTAAKGKVGDAMKFGQKRAGGGNSQSGSFVKPNWAVDVPLYVRAMALANNRLVIAGPPDLINEEETFAELTNNSESIQPLLKAQDEALNGSRGGVIQVVSTTTGKTIAKYETKSLPVWDGIITAYNRIYMSTTDGKIICLGK